MAANLTQEKFRENMTKKTFPLKMEIDPRPVVPILLEKGVLTRLQAHDIDETPKNFDKNEQLLKILHTRPAKDIAVIIQSFHDANQDNIVTMLTGQVEGRLAKAKKRSHANSQNQDECSQESVEQETGRLTKAKKGSHANSQNQDECSQESVEQETGDRSRLKVNLNTMINNDYFVDHIVVFGGTTAWKSHVDALAITGLIGSDISAISLQRDVIIIGLNAGYQSGESILSLSARLHEGCIYVFQCWDDYPRLQRYQRGSRAWTAMDGERNNKHINDLIFSWSDDLYVYGEDETYSTMGLFQLDVSNGKLHLLKVNNNIVKKFAAVACENSLYVIGGYAFLNGYCSAQVQQIVRNGDEIGWPPKECKCMSQARAGHASVKLNDYIYVCGGQDNTGDALSSCESYSIQEDKWTKIASMKVKRYDFSVVAANGKLFAIGGRNQKSSELSSIEVYHPDEDKWKVAPGRLQEGRYGHAAVVLPAEYTTSLFMDIIVESFEKFTSKK